MKNLFLTFAILAALTAAAGCDSGEAKAPKYVFYFIGDGMGINDVQVGIDYLRLAKGLDKKELNLTKFPVMGALRTYCNNAFVTDSSASGTALATGYKTNYGTAGVDPEMNAVDSVAVYAHKRGMKVGIVATVTLTEATPGAFFAHQESRGRYYPSTFDLVDSGFEYFAGGDLWDKEGKDVKLTNWQDATNILSRGVESCVLDQDGKPQITWKNAEKIIQENGYTYVTTQEDFENLKPGCGKVYVSHPDRCWGIAHRIENKKSPWLADYVAKGIELLDNEKGFFMMVEGSFIDHGNHSNDAPCMLGELLDFDDALGTALEFYEKHPDETLIVVTADHDTGALSYGFCGHHPEYMQYATCEFGTFNSRFESYQKKVAECRENHSHEVEGTFAEAKELLGECYGVGKRYDLHKEDWDRLEAAFNDSMDEDYDSKSPLNKVRYEGSKNPFCYVVKKVLNARFGCEYETGGHSAAPVPVFAIGCQAASCGGFKNNCELPVAIARAIDPTGEFPTKPYKKPILRY